MWDYTLDLIIFAAGWASGSLAVWRYFKSAGLIRTRAEYYAARKARGLSVPVDWWKS